MNPDGNAQKFSFDKKLYRKRKYDRSFQMQLFNNQRERIVRRKYNKILKHEGRSSSEVCQSVERHHVVERNVSEVMKTAAKTSDASKSEINERRLEREATKAKAVENREARRRKSMQVMNRRTRKGQPIMAGRIELLLDKIEQSIKTSQ